MHAQENKKAYLRNNHAKIYVVQISCKTTTFLKLNPSSEYLRRYIDLLISLLLLLTLNKVVRN